MDAPSYELERVQDLIRADEYRISAVALDGAGRLGWGVEEICECVLALATSDFYKTMESERKPGLWQDVYRPTFRGLGLYVKLQLTWVGDAVVISFKRR